MLSGGGGLLFTQEPSSLQSPTFKPLHDSDRRLLPFPSTDFQRRLLQGEPFVI